MADQWINGGYEVRDDDGPTRATLKGSVEGREVQIVISYRDPLDAIKFLKKLGTDESLMNFAQALVEIEDERADDEGWDDEG